eukprot:TRINITY_DN2399_c0_g1::TRINITY_DN2399_c0_g1_i1::g.20920::m.20920 TRINITY_DN2399_c0_g1::TRINITY_DN2399_c0_g1_i1::g.20920  ORF type:complete len:260 (+),score=34.00,R3H-assoc/PF13902.1/1.5e-11,R3H/PF01424.17/4.8e+03,R3H/PF01424.17/1.2e-06 TRINITY_DN2399_c0_g1_i1:97-876(+)
MFDDDYIFIDHPSQRNVPEFSAILISDPYPYLNDDELPDAAARQPRRRRQVHIRDSLKARVASCSYLGTRRRRRYEQDRALVDGYKSEVSDGDDDDDMFSLGIEHHSAFEELFSDPKLAATWEKFNKLSESEQRKKLSRKSHVRPTMDDSEPVGVERLQLIERRLRSVLRRELRKGNPYIFTLEEKLIEILQNPAASGDIPFIAEPTSSYSRLLAHAICQYYRIRSFSSDQPSGERLMFVKCMSSASLPDPPLARLVVC